MIEPGGIANENVRLATHVVLPGRRTDERVLQSGCVRCSGVVPHECIVLCGQLSDSSGILANETAAGYTLKQANGTETFIPRNQVSKIQSTGKSLMPEGLESDLTQQGLASLLAYILSQ